MLIFTSIRRWLTRALIKTVSPDDESGILCLERECQNYPLPGIASAKCFRTMYDVLDSRTVALEWLDTTLAGIKYKHDTPTIAMIKTVLREALTSCEILAAKKYVNTGGHQCLITEFGIG